MRDLTIMFTACGSQFAPGIVKCFKNNGERNIRVIGGDMNAHPTNNFIVDKFYQLPPVTSPEYVKSIITICENEKVDIFFPQMSAELSYLLTELDAFKKISTEVSMTQTESLKIANNKVKLYEFMKDNGISVAPFKTAHSLKEFESSVALMGYPEKPVCIKMSESSGSRGIRIIDGSKSLYDLFAHSKPESFHTSYEYLYRTLKEAPVFPELLIMKSLPGNEYTVDLLADHGKVLYIAGRNNAQMMGIAQESVIQENEQAFKIATLVVEGLKLDGVIGMDFIYDENGVAQLMDVNPRIDATVSIFAAGGLNLPYLCVKKILGEELPEVHVHNGIRLKRRYAEMFSDERGGYVDW